MWRLLSSTCAASLVWFGGQTGASIIGYPIPKMCWTEAAAVTACLYTSVFLFTGGTRTLWLAYMTLPRDLVIGVRYVQIQVAVWFARRNNMTVPKMFMKNVAKNPNKVALTFEGISWTFAEIDAYSNRVANFLVDQGLKYRDSIALYMENRPEYVATWLGCSKVGVVPALINFNLRHNPLVHCLKVASSKAIICGFELQGAISEVLDELGDLPVYVSGTKAEPTIKGGINIDAALKYSSPVPPLQLDQVKFGDNLLYIYTSGTTGLPKAAIIKHARFLFFSTAVHFLTGLTEDDIIYNPLPLYHTAGGMVGMGQVLIFNSSAVIRKKFSVTRYWSEAKLHNCTVAQYVGEICRYLLNSPPKPEDTQHKVRVMFGNGVRPQIWEQFTSRFNMPRIAEFYGATESNANIINFEGKPGAVGFLSVLFPSVYPARLMRVEMSTGELMRGADGFGVPCKPGEPGEFVGRIKRNDPIGDFHGYADKKATEKKIARNVFKKGDYAFLSGDILVMDELGYVYFKDRTGDTFRWRGENVSTAEVEGAVSQAADNRDAVVYGVEVFGAEGKAGMTAIVDAEDTLDLKTLVDKIAKYLPPYARPLFLRILKEIDTTGTFKLKKLDLQKQGYDVNNIKDKLYFLDSKNNSYTPLTQELYQKISEGKAGL